MLFAGVAYGGSKFYMHHKVGEGVDAAITVMAPFAQVSYRSIESTMGGSLAIRGIEVGFPSRKDTLQIDAIRLDTPNYFELIGLIGNLQEGEIPDSMAFNMLGIRVGLDDDYLKSVWRQAMEEESIKAAVEKAACTDHRFFSLHDYNALGYRSISFDYSFGYEHHPEDATLSIFFSMLFEDLTDFEATLNLDAAVMPDDPVAMRMFRPKLKTGEIRVTDHSFLSRIHDRCKEDFGLSDEQVLTANVEHFKDVMSDLGIIPDEPILEGYRQYLSSNGSFVMTAAPTRPTDLTRLGLYDKADVPNLLNLNVRVE